MKQKLPSVFNSMAASYKAYWFIAILECVNEKGETQISIKELCARMLVDAWYPVHFFKLNFGMQDLISQHNLLLKDKLNLNADIPKEKLLAILLSSNDMEVHRLIIHFNNNVTYRFLSPWVKYISNAQVIRDSQQYKNEAPYAIYRDNGTIEINPLWIAYLKDNYAVLKDYTYWKLANYIQTKNPGVPDIISKLVKPAKRSSLSAQRDFWNIVFDKYKTIQCIYTGEKLLAPSYAVEHYIPWSFTAHDLIWNLIPANTSINSSKSNKLPNDEFLESFIQTQKVGLETVYNIKPNSKLFEDYSVFGTSIPELIKLEDNRFNELFTNLIKPQIQLARQLGFQDWNYNLQ